MLTRLPPRSKRIISDGKIIVNVRNLIDSDVGGGMIPGAATDSDFKSFPSWAEHLLSKALRTIGIKHDLRE